MTGNPGLDGPRFQAQGAWMTLTTEMLLREEFELRGLTMETLQHVFPLYQVHPPPAAPVPAQGPPSPPAPAQGPPIPPAPATPLMPDSPGEAYVVIDIPSTPEVVVISSGDEDHQGDEDDPEEDDPEEDQDSDEMGIEQQGEQEADALMMGLGEEQEPQVQQEVDSAESEASMSSFDSGEEPDDESDPDYDPSRDR